MNVCMLMNALKHHASFHMYVYFYSTHGNKDSD